MCQVFPSHELPCIQTENHTLHPLVGKSLDYILKFLILNETNTNDINFGSFNLIFSAVKLDFKMGKVSLDKKEYRGTQVIQCKNFKSLCKRKKSNKESARLVLLRLVNNSL